MKVFFFVLLSISFITFKMSRDKKDSRFLKEKKKNQDGDVLAPACDVLSKCMWNILLSLMQEFEM